MSFAHASRPPGTADFQSLLPEVVAEVAEHAFLAWAEPCEPRRFAELLSLVESSPAVPSRWLRAHVRFNGVVSGSLDVLLPDELATELGVALTGAPLADGLTDQEQSDVAAELANVLCGVLLTRTDRRQPFELSPPEVARAADVLDFDGPTDGDLLFSVNDRPVVVRCVVNA